MNKRLQVGVIGLGIGMQHARAVAAHPGAELAMLCDLAPEKRAQAAAEFPDTPFVPNAEELLAADLDVVSIASFDDAHYLQARKTIEMGRHVYLEKPLCLRESETRELAALLRAHPDVRLSSNLVLRTCPRFVRLKQEMDAGALGFVYHLEADYLWGRLAKLTEGWRAEMEHYSIILGAAVHMVDLALWLTGQRPVSVAALGSNFATGGTRQRHNDFAVLLMRFPGGLSAKIAAHGGCTHPHFHRLAVYGTQKTFAGELPGAYWLDSSDATMPPRVENAAYPGREERGQALASFIDTLNGVVSRPLVDEAAAFAAMSVCHAAERAIETGRECAVDYFWDA
ncbi:MAG: Gfo/Idh/MocA family oxidoreductase [Humidesulfovibrio sp.]|uniref:Gfo/Idh/MocA family protein n=1 Tax=Humidesulfovibrio sp. TaxID=2910988 RepID=UPI0027EA62AD|nr:Gfo/Idh/MocA family oxidoreductase [Humidesulfovibrio sp.]MDQ7834243.1 Gfo/Idh/MocA family oxidoreductase [Humidesulfovibrio sp.]